MSAGKSIPVTILVVDDNEANRVLARSTLEDEGYSVVLANDGRAAVEAFERDRPDCVLMDLNESFGRYAVRYWLTDIAVDDPTDSSIRTRVYFALRRAGIPLSMPAHAVFLRFCCSSADAVLHVFGFIYVHCASR